MFTYHTALPTTLLLSLTSSPAFNRLFSFFQDSFPLIALWSTLPLFTLWLFKSSPPFLDLNWHVHFNCQLSFFHNLNFDFHFSFFIIYTTANVSTAHLQPCGLFRNSLKTFSGFPRISALSAYRKNYNSTTGGVHARLWIFVSAHVRTPVHLSMATIFAQSTRVHKCERLCVCLLAYVSTSPFVHVGVIWCVWCVVVKHIFLQAISFAYLSQPVHWVSGSLMHTVVHWHSWSPTAMLRFTPSVFALADRHHAHVERVGFVYVSMHTCTISSSQSQLARLSLHDYINASTSLLVTQYWWIA